MFLRACFCEKNSTGYGLNLKQAMNQNVGVFSHWSWNNGRTGTQTLDISASLSGGMTINSSSRKKTA
jgi:high affinity Mn2+ porin